MSVLYEIRIFLNFFEKLLWKTCGNPVHKKLKTSRADLRRKIGFESAAPFPSDFNLDFMHEV